MAAKKKDTKNKVSPHDVTPSGGTPNSFTKATRKEKTLDGSFVEKPAIPDRKRVRGITLSDKDKRDRASRRKSYDAVVNNTQDSIIDAPIGYRWMEPDRAMALGNAIVNGTEEERLDAENQIKLTSWLSGAMRAFPNESRAANTPAIDEPHEVSSASEASRRWEDLSSAEVDKAHQVMGIAGMPSNRSGKAVNAEADITGIQLRNMMRVMGEHAAAGVNENVSQHFYGGKPTADIPDPDLRAKRDSAHAEAQSVYQNMVINPIMESEQFRQSTAGMPQEEVEARGRYIGASSVSRTSPNTPFKRGEKFPNLIAAREVFAAANEGREINTSNLSGSRPDNAKRGLADMQDMLADASQRSTLTAKPHYSKGATEPTYLPDGTVRLEGTAAPKTGPFLTAMSTPNSAEQYVVTDVMESQQMMPWLNSAKGFNFIDSDASSGRPGVTVWQGRPGAPRGYVPKMRPEKDSAGNLKVDDEGNVVTKHEPGNNEAEEMLSKGGGLVHALNDKASRNVNAAMGLSRGVNYSDNSNSVQAARWGSEQAGRSSHFSSHADHYPVVRNWGAEGAGMTERPDWLGSSSNFDWMYESKNLSPQFADNPNTEGYAKSAVLRRQPYIM